MGVARCTLATVIGATALAGAAGAATLLYEISGPDLFGWAVANVGDLDGDQVPDFAVGAPGASILVPEPRSGAVYVYSGATGSPLGSFPDGLIVGDADADRFGSSVAAAGDVDGDQVPDILIGAIGSGRIGSPPGYAAIHSGADGSRIRRFDGFVSAASFGTSVAGIGNVVGDSTPDVLVGEPGAFGTYSGNAYVFDGATGSVAYSYTGEGARDNLGISVAAVGDATGDDVPDFAIGAPGAVRDAQLRPKGKLLIVSGATGAVVKDRVGASYGDSLGRRVAGVGDVDGNGLSDVGAAAPGLQRLGGVLVYDARGKKRLTVVSPFASIGFGTGVAGIADVSGDGLPDVAVGGDGQELAAVVAGRGGVPQFLHFGDPGDIVGEVLADAGDLTGDGVPELIVGAWGADVVRVFALDEGTPPGKLKSKLDFEQTPASGEAVGKLRLKGTPKKSLVKLIFKKLGATPPYGVYLEESAGSGTFFEVASVEPKPNGKAKLVLKSKAWPPGALQVTSLAELAGRRVELRDATDTVILAVTIPVG